MTTNERDTSTRQYVKEHRKDLLQLLRSDDPFVRALALAVLLESSDEADLELVKRELDLLQNTNGWRP